MALRERIAAVGQRTVDGIAEIGYGFALLAESIFWLIAGRLLRQPVSLSAIFGEAMLVGVRAMPIASLLCFAVGIMLAIQGIATLKPYGAQDKVVLGIAMSMSREFAPLIVSILVAGRSGSAIAARIGTMMESQEIDALRVMGINPVRYLAAPMLVAMTIAVPCLSIVGNVAGLLGGAVYTRLELQLSFAVYFDLSVESLTLDDVLQGFFKSIVFAIVIVLVGLTNGFQTRGGAEGVGRATTRAVVLAISLIVLTDMAFTYILNR